MGAVLKLIEAKLVSRIQTTPIHTGSVHFILYTEQPPNRGIICVYNLLQSIPAITSLEGLELNTRRKILVFVVGHQNLEKSDFDNLQVWDLTPLQARGAGEWANLQQMAC